MEAMSVLLGEIVKRAVGYAGDWLHLNEKRRAALFKEQVEPIHAVFKRFQADHMETFAQVRAALSDPKTPVQTIFEMVQTKSREQREAWLLFDRLHELAPQAKATPSDLYYSYLAQVRRCLRTMQGDEPVTIAYYGSLLERISMAINHEIRKDPTQEDPTRQKAVEFLDGRTLDFQKYCTDVEMAYMLLRQESLIT
jgi:hypothetical protein